MLLGNSIQFIQLVPRTTYMTAINAKKVFMLPAIVTVTITDLILV